MKMKDITKAHFTADCVETVTSESAPNLGSAGWPDPAVCESCGRQLCCIASFCSSILGQTKMIFGFGCAQSEGVVDKHLLNSLAIIILDRFQQ
jgi:hypothetical protein